MKKYIFLLSTLIFFPSISLGANYVVTPLLIEHDVQPRDMFEEVVKITNTTDQPIRIFPTVNEITLGEDGEIKGFTPVSMSNGATSVTSWIAVSRASMEIAPRDTVKLPVNFTVNPNAVAGEYHAFVGFADGANRDEAEKKVADGSAPGVVVRLSLVEKKSEYLRLNRFAISHFVINEKNSTADFDLENVGGLPVTPKGEIIFYNNKGVELKSVKINTEDISILPGHKELFKQQLPDLGFIGSYKAFLNIEYGTNQRANLYDTVYFNILPIKLLIVIFITLLFVSVMFTYLYFRSRNHQYEINENVSVYVRSGVTAEDKEHDIILKK